MADSASAVMFTMMELVDCAPNSTCTEVLGATVSKPASSQRISLCPALDATTDVALFSTQNTPTADSMAS